MKYLYCNMAWLLPQGCEGKHLRHYVWPKLTYKASSV